MYGVLSRVCATVAATVMIAACGGGSQSPASPSSSHVAGVALNGIVREAGTTRTLPGAHLVVTSGPDAGATAITDGTGAFVFPSLSPGPIDLEGRKAGYLAAKFTTAGVRPDVVATAYVRAR